MIVYENEQFLNSVRALEKQFCDQAYVKLTQARPFSFNMSGRENHKYTITSIFRDVQFSDSNHPSFKKILTDIYKKVRLIECLKFYSHWAMLSSTTVEKQVQPSKLDPNQIFTKCSVYDYYSQRQKAFQISIKNRTTQPILFHTRPRLFLNDS